MIGIALAFWSLAVAWPGTHIEILVLSGALVAWAVYGLLTEPLIEHAARRKIRS